MYIIYASLPYELGYKKKGDPETPEIFEFPFFCNVDLKNLGIN